MLSLCELWRDESVSGVNGSADGFDQTKRLLLSAAADLQTALLTERTNRQMSAEEFRPDQVEFHANRVADKLLNISGIVGV